MKTSSRFLLWLLLLAVSCFLVASPATAAGHGQLIVKRSANFGGNLGLDLYVDGQYVGRFLYGQQYSASLPAGVHQVSADVYLKRQMNPPVTRVTIHPGKTTQLAALWSGQD